MSCDLSDEEAAALERLLRDAIDAGRYPLPHQCDQRGRTSRYDSLQRAV